MFPRFRIAAVSMKRLQIGKTCILAVTVAVIHLNPVVMLEEHPRSSDGCVANFDFCRSTVRGARMSGNRCRWGYDLS